VFYIYIYFAFLFLRSVVCEILLLVYNLLHLVCKSLTIMDSPLQQQL